MKILFLSLVLFFVIVTPVFAQSSKEGYIVTYSNDTLRGRVIDQPKNLFKEVAFQTIQQDGFDKYDPIDIKGFSFENRVFRSKTMDEKERKHRVFLEVGKINLYQLTNNFKEHRFFVEKAGNLQELILAEKKWVENGVQFAKDDKQFVSTLDILTLDCSEVNKKVNKVSFSLRSLSSFIRSYNKSCDSNFRSESFQTTQSLQKVTTQYSIYGGVNFIGMSTKNSRRFPDPGNSTGIHLGATAYLRFPGMSERLWINLSLSYNQKGVENSDMKAKFDLDLLGFSPGLTYRFYKKGKNSLNVSFGGIYASLLNNEDQAFTQINLSGDRLPYFSSVNRPPGYELGYFIAPFFQRELSDNSSLKIRLSYEGTTLTDGPANEIFNNKVLQVSLGIIFH